MVVKRSSDSKLESVLLNADESIDTFVEVYEALVAKVDKVDGKGLSTNDYTAEDKSKVDKLTVTTNVNLDDIVVAISTLAMSMPPGSVLEFEESMI